MHTQKQTAHDQLRAFEPFEVAAYDWASATIEPAQRWVVKIGDKTVRRDFRSETEARAFVDAAAKLARDTELVKEPTQCVS